MPQGGFSRFFLRVTACHMVTYFLAGVLAFTLLDGPAPGSVEGLLYTTIPPLDQLKGLSEVVGQSLAFSILLTAWYRRPHKAWGIVLYTLIGLVVLMSVAGALVPR